MREMLNNSNASTIVRAIYFYFISLILFVTEWSTGSMGLEHASTLFDYVDSVI